MKYFRLIQYYFSVYQKYSTHRLHYIFVLSLLTVMTESVGISLLLPLLNAVDSSGQSQQFSGYVGLIDDMLVFFGLSGSVQGILLFIGIIFLGKGLLKFLEGVYGVYLKTNLLRDLKSRMFDAYTNMSYLYFSQHNTGHFINVLNSQTNYMSKSFDNFKAFVCTLITMLCYFSFAFLINWAFAVTALFSGGILLFFLRNINVYVRSLSRKSVTEQGILNNFLVQSIQAFKYINSTAEIVPLRKGVTRSIKELTRLMKMQGVAASFTSAIREPVSIIVLIGIILVEVTFFESDLAPILVSLLLIYRAMGQIMGVQTAWQSLMSNIGSLEVIEKEFDLASKNKQVSGMTIMGPLKKGIEMKELNFSYLEKNGNVLNQISLVLKANKTIALVGESGSGKSTLVDMLTLLLRPDSGKLIVDGVTHEEIDTNSWRSQIGYVSQDTVVFDDTIANNICLWRGDFNEDDLVKSNVLAVAEQAYAKDFIENLPDGYNTVVGDRGVKLSGGQKQRLFIARELYKQPSLLILDEATSALDAESELFIKKSIDNLKGRTTVVIIAHRLSTIKDVDYIYVLKNGRVMQEGTYNELLSGSDSDFKRMVNMQAL